MPEYHYRFFCTTCGEKLVWEGDDHSDDFYIEPCQTCLQSAAQQSVQPTPESGRELPAKVVKVENTAPAESG